jgi:hypothetical protein
MHFWWGQGRGNATGTTKAEFRLHGYSFEDCPEHDGLPYHEGPPQQAEA